MLTDSHCHLDFPDFASELDAVVARARGGRGRAGSSPSRPGSRRNAEHRRHRGAVPGRLLHGRHPPAAGGRGARRADRAQLVVAVAPPQMRRRSARPGLDYHYDAAPRDVADSGVPHPHRGGPRDRPAAGHPRARRRRRHGGDPPRRDGAAAVFSAVLHCFSSSAELAATGLELGFYGLLFWRGQRSRAPEALAGHRPRRAARPHAGRDRRAVPGPRCPIAASGTSRPSWPRPRACWPRSRGSTRAAFAEATSRNVDRLFSKLPGRMAASA